MSTTSEFHTVEIATITCTGRLDALEAAPMRETVASHLDAGANRLVVDLSDVEFVDSAGLAALVRGMKDARSVGGDLRLVSPKNPDAMRVFELTKFDSVFDMFDDAVVARGSW